MKNLIIYIIVTLIFCGLLTVDCGQVHAQVKFQKHYNSGSNPEYFINVHPISNGGYLAIGTSNNITGSTEEFIIVELDMFGNKVNQKGFGGSYKNFGHYFVAETDTSYVLAGGSNASSGNSEDIVITSIKKDFSQTYWTRWAGGSGREYTRLAEKNSTGYYGIGWTNSMGDGWQHYSYKINNNGSFGWSKSWGGAGTEKTEALALTKDGGFLVAGEQSSNAISGTDAIVYKFDSTGNTLQWAKTFSASTGDAATGVIQTKDGNYVVTGQSYRASGPGGGWLYDVFMMKLDTAGNILWSYVYGDTMIHASWWMGRHIIELEDSSIVIGGTGRTTSNGLDAYLIKTNKNGDLQWSRRYGSSSTETIFDIVAAPDGGFLLTGQTNGFGAGSNYNCYVIKTDANGLSGCNEDTTLISRRSHSFSSASRSYTINNHTNNTTGGSLKTASVTANTQCIANDGRNCANAYLLTEADYNNTVFTMTDTVMWFRFVADTLYDYLLKNANNVDTLYNIKFYALRTDSCNGNLQNQDSVTNQVDFSCFDFLQNKNYLLKISQYENKSSIFKVYKKTRREEYCKNKLLALLIEEDSTFYQIIYKIDNYIQENPQISEEDGIIKNYQRWKRYWGGRVDSLGMFSEYAKKINEVLNTGFPVCNSDIDDLINWEILGPFTTNHEAQQNMARIDALSINPKNPRSILAGGRNGGIWKTENMGETWRNVTDNENFSILGIGSFARHPKDTNIIYAGTIIADFGVWSVKRTNTGAGVIMSTDGGETWQFTGLRYNTLYSNSPYLYTQGKNIIAIDPRSTLSKTTIYAGGEVFLHKWNGNYLADEEWDIFEESWGCFANGCDSTMPRQHDGIKYSDMAFESDGTFWYSNSKGLFRIDPVTQARDSIEFEVPDHFFDHPCGFDYIHKQSIDIDINRNDEITVFLRLYAADETCRKDFGKEGHFIFRSNNSGGTFIRDTTNLNPWGGTLIMVSAPFDYNRLYGENSNGNDNSAYRDMAKAVGTNTFLKMPALLGQERNHDDIRTIVSYGGNPSDLTGVNDTLFIGTDGGVSVTFNGNNWTDITGVGLTCTNIYGVGVTEFDDNLIFTGSHDGNINLYYHGAWHTTTPGGDNGDCLIEVLDSSYRIFQEASSGSGVQIYRGILQNNSEVINDTTITPTGSNAILTSTPIVSLSNVNNNIYAAYEFLYFNQDKFTANQNNWVRISDTNIHGRGSVQSIAVVENDTNTVYYAINYTADITKDGIYKAVRSGSSWVISDVSNNLRTSGRLPASITDITVDPYNKNKLYVCLGGVSDGKKVYKSVNGGSTWTNISSCLPNIPMTSIVYQTGTNDRVYVGSDFGVFCFDSLNQEWFHYGNGGPKCMVSDMEINYCGKKLVVATQGRGLWEVPLLNANDAYNQALRVTSSETWNTRKVMKRDIVVEDGAVLTVTDTVQMHQDGKITVERGGKLIVDGGLITNVCGNLWAGIEVHGNNTQDQPLMSAVLGGSYPSASTHHGVVILKNGATISNAKTGVYAGKRKLLDVPNAAYGGGIVVADDSYFENNKIAVEFIKYKRDTSISKIKNCNFITNNNFEMNTFAKLTEINGVQFIADSFMNDNVMGYRGKGIQAIDAGIHVKPECTLYSLGAGGCGSFNRNVFKDLDYGIEILAITPAVKPYNTIITENRFVNNAKNLRLKGSQWAMVTKNQFVLDNDALYSGYGIMVEGSRYFKIEENTFTNNMDTWAWFNNTYIDMTGLSAERIYKNTYNGSNTAAWGIGAGRRNWQLQLKCNEFNHEQDNILALAPIALDEQQGNCGGSWMNQTQLDQAPAGNIFATTCNTTNAHIWVNSTATPFTYNYHNATRREPLNSCINDLGKIEKNDCFGSQVTSSCPSELPYSGGVIIFINRIKNNTLVADSFYTHIDKGNTMGMLEYVFNTGVSAATLTDSLINASWLSDHTLSAIFQRTPALNNVQKSLVLMRNSPHTQLMRHTIEQQGLQATIDSLDNAGIVLDTATTRFEIILAINQLNYDKNIAYNEWAYQVALDSTGANYSQLIDTLKTETTISYLLKLADFYIATEQYNKADSVLLYSIIGNPVGTLMFEHSDEYLMNTFTTFLTSYMQRHNLSWYDLLTPEEQGGEETYDREDLLDFMEDLAGYDISAGMMAQNILTMIYDTTFNELIIQKDEEMMLRKAQPEEEQKNLEETVLNKVLAKVYPNPAKDEFTIEFSETNKEYEVKIYSVLGINVVTEKLNTKSITKHTLNIRGYEKGVYLYQLKDEKGNIQSGRLLIM